VINKPESEKNFASLRSLTDSEAYSFVAALRKICAEPEFGTMSKVAAKAGVSPTTLYRWLKGGSVSSSVASKVADGLGMTRRGRRGFLPKGEISDLTRITDAYKRTFKWDDRARCDLVSKCAIYFHDRLDREGVDSGIIITPRSHMKAQLEVEAPEGRFVLELLPEDKGISYRLSEGPRNHEALSGVGEVSREGSRFCIEFIKGGPVRNRENTPKTFRPFNQLNELYRS